MDTQHCLQCELHKDRRDQDGYKYCYCFFNPDKGRWIAEIENCPKLEKEISKDIEEAAKQYFENPENSWEVREVFIAAAKWDREQMMKKAVEADVNIYRDIAAGKSWAEFVVEMPTNNLGDKAKIIVINETNV